MIILQLCISWNVCGQIGVIICLTCIWKVGTFQFWIRHWLSWLCMCDLLFVHELFKYPMTHSFHIITRSFIISLPSYLALCDLHSWNIIIKYLRNKSWNLIMTIHTPHIHLHADFAELYILTLTQKWGNFQFSSVYLNFLNHQDFRLITCCRRGVLVGTWKIWVYCHCSIVQNPSICPFPSSLSPDGW